jgi:ubiquinone/menaquinone biosynthesis C-methylase UbiE
MKQWNEIFKAKGRVFSCVQEDMPKILKLFKNHKIKKVLDLGCGTGRHVIYLAKNGFEVYGLDIAEEGIRQTKVWLKKTRLKANLKVGSIYAKLPYSDNFFDAVISTHTFHHQKIEVIRQAIKELIRVLKSGGLIFMTFRKRKFNKNWAKNTIIEKYGRQKNRYKVIAQRTYMPIEGGEKGLPHYLFNKKLIKKEFDHFKVLNIWVALDKRHYSFLGELEK